MSLLASFVGDQLANWEEKGQEDGYHLRRKEKLLNDLQKYHPRQFEDFNKREAKLKGKIERLESQMVTFDSTKDNLPLYLDPLWWMERSGKELDPHLATFAFIRATDIGVFEKSH